jgi:hypothetical protein
MNLGKIKSSNEKFLKDYKRYGFATKTELANAAFEELRHALSKKKRQQWRKEAALEYEHAGVENAFASIESDDYVR